MPSFAFPTGKNQSLKAALSALGFDMGEAPHAVFQARSGQCSVTLYQSGKLLIQGRGSEECLDQLFAKGLLAPPEPTAGCWLGVDESGKGDLFGPLVIAGVGLTAELTSLIYESGARDSKELSDSKIRELAGFIRQTLPHEIVVILPEKYNQLYASFNNLNRLLAWGHGKVFENLCGKCEPELAVFDQFADRKLLDGVLAKKGKKVEIIQRTKGESDLAVACASILARAEFVRRIYQLSDKCGIKLPLGGGDQAKRVAKQIIASKGREYFATLAKAHFKID
ncbi:MAG: ribonuclease HIII [Candidatus Wallbacteria bacterium]|nr:ribonuclease HIII [Candidatus Wallbacteria bacterium]